MGKRKTPYDTRFREVLRAYLGQLIGAEQKAIAIKAEVSQGSLSEMLSGKKHVTLEVLDKVGIAKEKSVAQMLRALSDVALEIPSAVHFDRETPPVRVSGSDKVHAVADRKTARQISAAVRDLRKKKALESEQHRPSQPDSPRPPSRESRKHHS